MLKPVRPPQYFACGWFGHYAEWQTRANGGSDSDYNSFSLLLLLLFAAFVWSLLAWPIVHLFAVLCYVILTLFILFLNQHDYYFLCQFSVVFSIERLLHWINCFSLAAGWLVWWTLCNVTSGYIICACLNMIRYTDALIDYMRFMTKNWINVKRRDEVSLNRYWIRIDGDEWIN